MKTKRFIATDMRTAMNRVRAEQGADAVILSQRQVPGGVELLTTTHYQPGHQLVRSSPASAAKAKPKTPAAAALARAAVGLARRSTQSLSTKLANKPQAAVTATAKTPSFSKTFIQSAAQAASLATLPADDAPVIPAFTRPRSSVALTAKAPSTPFPVDKTTTPSVSQAPPLSAVPSSETQTPQLQQLRQEIAQMRRMMEAQLAHFNDQRLRGNPARNQALDWLEIRGFAANAARQIVAKLPADTDPAAIQQPLLDNIRQQIPIASHNPLQEGGIVALVGPSGAGKTTTAAKLAAHFLQQHSARDVALVSASVNNDSPHASALLHSFGRQLGVAVHEASNAPELGLLLKRLSDYRLVLIDSASPDRRHGTNNSLQWFIRASAQVNTLLVLPATTGVQEMQDVLRRFSSHRPQAAVLTRLDETVRLGAALSVAMQQSLPLAWFSDGQNILNDLHQATATALVQRLEDLSPLADKADMAELEHALSPNPSLANMELRHVAA